MLTCNIPHTVAGCQDISRTAQTVPSSSLNPLTQWVYVRVAPKIDEHSPQKFILPNKTGMKMMWDHVSTKL